MAKKIKNMNKAELIVYAASRGIEVDRYMTIKQIIAALTEPVPKKPELSETPVIDGMQANAPVSKKLNEEKGKVKRRLLPRKVMCAACGRFVLETETKECPTCHKYHCSTCAVPGTCIKCGLELDPVLRKLKKEQKEKAENDNKSKKQTD